MHSVKQEDLIRPVIKPIHFANLVQLLALVLTLWTSFLCRSVNRYKGRRQRHHSDKTRLRIRQIARHVNTAQCTQQRNGNVPDVGVPKYQPEVTFNETRGSSFGDVLSLVNLSVFDVPLIRDVALIGDVLLYTVRWRPATYSDRGRPRYRCTLMLSALIMTMTGTEATDPMQDARANAAECSQKLSEPTRIQANSNVTSSTCQQMKYSIHASARQAVSLHFTHVYGFAMAPRADGAGTKCPAAITPRVTLVQELDNGREYQMGALCTQQQHQYFDSTKPLILTYNWRSQEPASGFEFELDFIEKEDTDSFPCTELILKWELDCNDVADCADATDEQPCQGSHMDASPSRTMPGADDRKWGVLMIIGIVAVVLLVVLLLGCAFQQCRVVSSPGRGSGHHQLCHHASPRGRHHSDSSSDERNHLNSNLSTPQTSARDTEVVYVPSATRPTHSTQLTLPLQSPSLANPPPHVYSPPMDNSPPSSVVGDIPEQFPPHIARSADGEEGYAVSQRQLQEINCDLYHRRDDSELIRAPPNRTVHDGESPPPYNREPRSWTFGCHDEHAKLARAVAERHKPLRGTERQDELLVSDTSDAFDPFTVNVGLFGGGGGDASMVGIYGSPRTTRISSAPSHLRTTSPAAVNVAAAATCINNSHQHPSHHHLQHHQYNGAPPPPYPQPPEYTPESDNVFVNTSTVAATSSTMVTSTSDVLTSSARALAPSALHAS